MRTRMLLILMVVLGAVGCSFVHTVRLENISDSPVTIAYKLRPTDEFHGLFFESPMILRKHGREQVKDTSTVWNPADSVVTFTLAPGDMTYIGRCINCTLPALLREGAVDPWAVNGLDRINIYWMRIEHAGESRTYAPRELLELATKKKLARTVLSIKT